MTEELTAQEKARLVEAGRAALKRTADAFGRAGAAALHARGCLLAIAEAQRDSTTNPAELVSLLAAGGDAERALRDAQREAWEVGQEGYRILARMHRLGLLRADPDS